MESSQRSVGDLTRDLSEQTSVLVRKELALASAEMKEKATHEVAVDTETVKEAARRGFDRTEAHDGR